MSEPITLSAEQDAALKAIVQWVDSFRSPLAGGTAKKHFTLGGVAGSGKSTVVSELIRVLEIKGMYVHTIAPTGKATQVLRSKGVLLAQTLHAFVYNFRGESTCERTGMSVPQFEAKEQAASTPDLVICDEASMVNQDMFDDLAAFGFPVLFVGDHAQLPPIGGDPGLMANPDVKLEEIHRQAAGNPILQLAQHIRTGGHPRDFDRSNSANREYPMRIVDTCPIVKLVSFCLGNSVDQVLCSFNNTRHSLNREFRSGLGRTKPIEVGDRLICLMNNHPRQLYNGTICFVTEVGLVNETIAHVDMVDEDGRVFDGVPIYIPMLGQNKSSEIDPPKGVCLFDYAWAVTVHKSQGSSWKHVVVIDQPFRSGDMARLRYTAVTRASQKLVWML